MLIQAGSTRSSSCISFFLTARDCSQLFAGIPPPGRGCSYPGVSWTPQKGRIRNLHIVHEEFDLQFGSMAPFRRPTPRVQFLPNLPSDNVTDSVKSHATQVKPTSSGGEPASRQCSKSSVRHPTDERNSARKRRPDFPLVRTGRSHRSHVELDEASPSQMRDGLNELLADMYASSSRGPRDPLLRT